MMLKILGLPPNVKNYDIKTLIKKECNISEIILDELVDDFNGCKNIKVGLANDEEGYRVMNCLNGFRFGDQYLIKVEQVGTPTSSVKQQTYPIPTLGSQSYHNQRRSDLMTQNIGYERTYTGQPLGTPNSDSYGSGQYGTSDSGGQWKQSRQFDQTTDNFGSANYDTYQAGYQSKQNQRQWANEDSPEVHTSDYYPNRTNRRRRSPEEDLPTSFFTKMLHDLTNRSQRLEDERLTPQPAAPFGRHDSRRPQSSIYPERSVSPERPRFEKPQDTSGRNMPSSGVSVDRPKSPSWKSPAWSAPLKYSSTPSISRLNQSTEYAPGRKSDQRLIDEDRSSSHHDSSLSHTARYSSMDNKNVRYPASHRSDRPQEKHMDINPQVNKIPPPFQTQESNLPMYTSGYPHSQKANTPYSTPESSVHQRPWQHDMKNVPDPNKFDIKHLPMHTRTRSRSPVRERSPLREAGSTSPKRSWSNETRPQSFNRPPPFVWSEQSTQEDKTQHPTAWNPNPFQESIGNLRENNSQRFDNNSRRVEYLERNRQPEQFERSRESSAYLRSNVTHQRNDYREPNDSDRHIPESHRSQQFDRPPTETHHQLQPRHADRDDEIYKSAHEPRSANFNRYEERTRNEESRSRHEKHEPERPSEPAWNTDDVNNLKRDRAAEEIVNTIMKKHQYLAECGNDERLRVIEELKHELGRLFIDMFGDRDISYIEIIIKYKAKFGDKDEEILIENVLSRLSIEMTCSERTVQESPEIPAQMPRHSQESHLNTDNLPSKLSDPNVPDWKLNVERPAVVATPEPGAPQMPIQQAVSPTPPVVQQQLPNSQINVATQIARINIRQQVAMSMMTNQLNVVPNLVSNMIPKSISSVVPSVIRNAVPRMVPNVVSTMVPNTVPTMVPNTVPTMVPNTGPIMVPNAIPTMIANAPSTIVPNAISTMVPNTGPIRVPNAMPTMIPNTAPTRVPNAMPTMIPNSASTMVPNTAPTRVPNAMPTMISNAASTMVPNAVSTMVPNTGPTLVPNGMPTMIPNAASTMVSNAVSTLTPNTVSTMVPNAIPTMNPNVASTMVPNAASTMLPNIVPTMIRNTGPTMVPNQIPTMFSNAPPTMVTKTAPAVVPNAGASIIPNVGATMMPNSSPTMLPNPILSMTSNVAPTMAPNQIPVMTPNATPTMVPSAIPTIISNSVTRTLPNVVPSMISNVPSGVVVFDKSYLSPITHAVGFSLYLCKENSGAFTDLEVDEIKTFLVSRIMRVNEFSQGWTPDITFKGLQCVNRYELFTTDDVTKKWLHKLDFSEIRSCSILLYTAEELWYERAAIWLPGHSKKNTLEPFEKIKLQNKKLDDVHINKWKLVKKIVTLKGTRLYVDVMPSAIKALEYYKMRLSYELQKVHLFLKKSAIDKDAFDAGMEENSVTDRSEIMKAARSTHMPTLPNGPSVVKLTIGDLKFLTPLQAHKIKEIVVYHLFRYHSHGGTSSTDFLRYGFISPNLVGIVPENEESKRWLLDHRFGQLHSAKIVVVGTGSRKNIKYITMYVTVNTYKAKCDRRSILDTLKKSNNGIEALNFHLWEPQEIQYTSDKKTVKLYIDIDIKSIETLMDMNFTLNFIDHLKKQTVHVKSEYSQAKFMEMFKQKKSEIDDSSVTDMEFSSDEDDVVCLD